MDERIITLVKRRLMDKGGCHDWDHTKRVFDLCMHIGKVECADLDVLGLSALLHDIARFEEDMSKGRLCHAKEGAKIASSILKDLGYPDDIIGQVVHCIASHRYRDKVSPKTIEAKILFDADKLDSIGAIGVGRAFLFAGKMGAKLHIPDQDIASSKEYSQEDTAYREFFVKLRFIKDKLLTGEGKRIAEMRHDFMVSFFDQLDKEVKGYL